MLSPSDFATLRADYADPDPTREAPDPRLVALFAEHEKLLALRAAVGVLLPDLQSSEDESCTVCGEALEHTDDCPVWPLLTAYARVSPRRVPGRPAGQRIAENPTPEAREVLGLDSVEIERWSVEETCPDGGWWAVLDRCDDDAGPYPPVALFRRKADADGYVVARDADGELLAYDACVTPAAILADGTLAVANDYRVDDHAALSTALEDAAGVATTEPDVAVSNG
jgi:hypothetical protein